jgi:hypothetical protein
MRHRHAVNHVNRHTYAHFATSSCGVNSRAMAIMPHCVVCGFHKVAGDVRFANYTPGWTPPTDAQGYQIIGWSNELGVTAPDGVGLFCRKHLKRAKRLRRRPSQEAVERMQSGGPLARLRRVFG